MTKPKDEVTQIDSFDEDIGDFEELEGGGMDKPEDALPEDAPLDLGADDGLEIPDLEEPLPGEGLSVDEGTERELEEDFAEEAAPEEESLYAPEGDLTNELLNLAPDVPVNLVAVIGKTTMSIAEIMKYRIGETIDLGRPPNETVDLVANGKLIARGELVEIDGKLGVKIMKMVK